MSTSGRGSSKAPAPEHEASLDEISFADLVPARQARSLYPHLKVLDGKRVLITDLGHEGKDEKTGFYVVLDNGDRYSVPVTIAKKVQIGLQNAKNRGLKDKQGRTVAPAMIQALDRGVRLG